MGETAAAATALKNELARARTQIAKEERDLTTFEKKVESRR
jgi:hypothetical protein